MARRRPGGAGSAQGAAAVGGAAWRQQQQVAELRAQLQLLPRPGQDVREWLLQGVGRVLDMVESHVSTSQQTPVLQGVGRVLDMVESHVSTSQQTPVRSHAQDGAAAAGVVAAGAPAAAGWATAVEQEEVGGMQEGAGNDEGEDRAVVQPTQVEELPLVQEEAEAAAADAAVGALKELLAAAVGALAAPEGDAPGGAGAPVVGTGAGAAMDALMRPGAVPNAPWDWGLYCSSLVHHYLLLSTELLPGAVDKVRRGQQQLLCSAAVDSSSTAPTGKIVDSSVTGNSSTSARDAGPGTVQLQPELAWDELAPAARRRPLAVGVYGRVVAAMGWHGMALDLMQWLPAGERCRQGELQQRSLGSVRADVCGLCLADVVRECPGTAPGYARVLLSGAGAAPTASATESASFEPAVGAGAVAAQGLCEDLAASPHLLCAIAVAVKGAAAAAAAAASSSGHGAAGHGGQGSVAVGMHPTARASSHVAVPVAAEGWLWCCLLLGRALASALGGARGTVCGAGPVGPAPSAGHLGGGAAGVCEEGNWAEACAGALEEGLCAWQDAVCGADASDRSSAMGRVGGGGSAGAVEQATAVGEQLLRVLQGQLLPLLEEEARLHMAAQLGRQQQLQEQQQQQHQMVLPVLSCGTAVRLRARVSLLLMAAGKRTGGSVAAEGQQQQQPRHGVGLAEASGGGGTDTQCGASASAVWDAVATLSLPASMQGLARPHGAGQDTAGTGATAAPPWLCRASGHVSVHAHRRKSAAALPAAAAAAAAACGEQLRLADALPMQQLASLLQRKLRLPGATPPHRAAPSCSSRPPATPLQLGHGAQLDAQGHVAGTSMLRAQGVAGQGLEERLAAVACALLTPGLPSWLAAQRDPRVRTAAGPSPYSSFRTALACLEMLRNAVGHAAVLGAGEAGEQQQQGEVEGQLKEGGAEGRRREVMRTLLRMAAECLVCTAGVEQQAALQAVVVGSEAFAGFRRHLAADADLQSAAASALVALSNRTIAPEGSLHRGLALGPEQEAARLAAAARELLPYALLVPYTCMRRLAADGLMHAGQQGWVLQLLGCFRIAAAAAAVPSGQAGGGAGSVVAGGGGGGGGGERGSLLAAALLEVLADRAGQLAASAALRRSAAALLGGVAAAGVVTPRELLAEVAAPLLAAAAAGAGVQQAHVGILAAQHLLSTSPVVPAPSGPPGAAPAHALPYNPSVELAAAGPARLLLAVADCLRQQYDTYEAGVQHDKEGDGSNGAVGGRPDAALLESASALLERVVLLYSRHVAGCRDAAGAVYGSAEQRELELLAAGALGGRLPKRLVAALLPLLDWAPPNAQNSDDDDGHEGPSADTHAHTLGSAWRLRREELVALLAPAAAWRPRALRTAGPDVAVQVLYDMLSFAGSADRHAAGLREALLEAAASREEQEQEDEDGQSTLESTLHGGAVTLWSSFGAEAVSQGHVGTSMGATCQLGPVGRHVAATAARGLPQLPPSQLLCGAVDAAARLLSTSPVDQAVRALAGVLPAVLRAAGGGAAVLQEAEAHPERGAEEGEGPEGPAPGMRELKGMALRERGRGRWHGEVVEAAGVALSMAVACRGSAKAVTAAAAAASAAADGSHVVVFRVQATLDRCAATLASLVSRLKRMAHAALEQQQQHQAAKGQQAGGWTATAAAAAAACPEVVSSTLWELAGVVAAASATGLPLSYDTWQAMMLSLLELLVAVEGAVEAVAVDGTERRAVEGAVEGRASTPAVVQHGGASGLAGTAGAKNQEAGVLGSGGELLVARVRDRVGGALGRLPGAMRGTLWAAAECMCEAA